MADLDGLDDDRDDRPGGPDAAGKKKGPDRKQIIIVVASVVGVIIAWISYRSSKSNTAAPAAPVATSGYPSTGQVAGQGSPDDDSSYLNQLASQLTAGQQSLAQQLQASQQAQAQASSDAQSGFSTALSNLSSELSSIESGLQSPTGTSTATPPASPSAPSVLYGPAAAGASYVRNSVDGAIYQVTPSGMVHLQPADYAALGDPSYTSYVGAPAYPVTAAYQGPVPTQGTKT